MSSTGNIRVNGGFENAVNMQSGSLMFVTVSGVDGLADFLATASNYLIAGGAWSNDHVVAEGETVPYSGAEHLYNVLSRRATVIGMHVETAGVAADDVAHVILENNVEGWLVNHPDDNTGPDNPGIAPKTDPVVADHTLPSLQDSIRSLGTISVPDVGSGSGTTAVDFSGAIVTRSFMPIFDSTKMIAE